MSEEISRILKMVEEGKIDSEKAMQLIEVLKVGSNGLVNLDKVSSDNRGSNSNASINGKMLRIKNKIKR